MCYYIWLHYHFLYVRLLLVRCLFVFLPAHTLLVNTRSSGVKLTSFLSFNLLFLFSIDFILTLSRIMLVFVSTIRLSTNRLSFIRLWTIRSCCSSVIGWRRSFSNLFMANKKFRAWFCSLVNRTSPVFFSILELTFDGVNLIISSALYLLGSDRVSVYF